MKFSCALEALKIGEKIKLPHWSGYWVKEDNSIKMYCKDGRVLDVRDTEDVFYTVGNMASEEWEIVDSNTVINLDIRTFGFGEAIRYMKNGAKVCRTGWNGKGMFVVYQKGYPAGIPCNKQTADAWGMAEGELFKCEPYLQIKMVNGSHAMWVPSINDVLAEDWQEVK